MEAVSELMATEGPVIQAVVLGTDGEAKEVTIDMTPKKVCSPAP